MSAELFFASPDGSQRTLEMAQRWMECDTDERRALKEHINILEKGRESDREREGAGRYVGFGGGCVHLWVGGSHRVVCVYTYHLRAFMCTHGAER